MKLVTHENIIANHVPGDKEHPEKKVIDKTRISE